MTQSPERSDVALRRAIEENIALRCMLAAGCDANNDGPHSIVGTGKNEFCHECGQMTKGGKSKPWFTEERLERIINRLATSTGKDGGSK